jgi:hypothetical protein
MSSELKRLDTARADVLALFHFSEKKPLQGIASLVDWRFHGHLSNLIIDGFLTGDTEETLLMPTGGRLGQNCLLVFGIGSRGEFGKRRYIAALRRMFRVVHNLGLDDIVLTLPGRIEETCTPTEAMEWLLSCYEEQSEMPNISILEPVDTQKTMMPLAERWRLKQLVP